MSSFSTAPAAAEAAPAVWPARAPAGPLTRRPLLRAAAWLAAGAACGGALCLPAQARAEVRDLNDAINQAGRQRMLSQRMAKAWLALAHGMEPSHARQVLAQSVQLFEQQLAALQAHAPDAPLRATYAQLQSAWTLYRARLLDASPAPAAAPALLRADADVLALAHQGTQQYEAALARPVGHLVNLAGRQRMLSQRMAKFYLAAALPGDGSTALAEIATARTEFLQAMQTLRSAPQATQRIQQQLRIADDQWVFFEAALHRIQPGATPAMRSMSEVFTVSENLLGVIDAVTGLYAQLRA